MAPRANEKLSKSRRAKQKQQSQGSPSTMPSEAVIDAQLFLAFDIMAAEKACAAARAAARKSKAAPTVRILKRSEDATAAARQVKLQLGTRRVVATPTGPLNW